jgi:hypothetical protein
MIIGIYQGAMDGVSSLITRAKPFHCCLVITGTPGWCHAMVGHARRSGVIQTPLAASKIGPVEVGQPVYGLIPGRDAQPYWANEVAGDVLGNQWSDTLRVEAAFQAQVAAS